MPAWRSWCAVGLAAGAAWPAFGQQMQLEPSAGSSCLTTLDAEQPLPVYPWLQYKERSPGRVLVELDFDGPDRAPAVNVLQITGDPEFANAVKTHARQLRVPCLPAGETLRLRQEFVFKTDDRQVYGAAPVDARDPKREAMMGCIVHPSGKMAPDYPGRALRQGQQGRVLVSLRFDATDRPPQAQIFNRPSAAGLAAGVEDWVRGYRMPCNDGTPVTVSILYIFKIEGEAYGFKPLTLRQLLGSMQGLNEARLNFDTTAMGCPFQVQLMYRQPYMRNVASSVGDANPARWPLLQWLNGIQLNLPETTLDAVFGYTAEITVPCLKIDIKPKEKSS